MTRDHRNLPPDVTRPDPAPAPAALPASVEETERRLAAGRARDAVLEAAGSTKPRKSFRAVLEEYRAGVAKDAPATPPSGPRLARAWPEAGT